MFRQVTDIAWDKAKATRLHQRWLHQFARVAKISPSPANWLGSFGERRATSPGQFNTPAFSSRPMRNDNGCTSPIAATGVSRCSTTDGKAAPADHDRRAGIRRERQAGDRQQVPESIAPDRHVRRPSIAGVPLDRCASRRRRNQVLYTSDAYPGADLQAQPRRQGARHTRPVGQGQLKQFGWIHEIACPSENTLYAGGTAELAGAEADVEAIRPITVIASEAKQSRAARTGAPGLLRGFAPRNEEDLAFD